MGMSDVTVTVAFKPLDYKCEVCGTPLKRKLRGSGKRFCKYHQSIENIKNSPNWIKHRERQK